MSTAIANLLAAVKTASIKADQADTEQIISDGFEECSNEFILALEGLSLSDMESMKNGEDRFTKPKITYETIVGAVSEMLMVRECRETDRLRYAELTGHDLASKNHHDADNGVKVRKALVHGEYINLPLIRVAQAKRNTLSEQHSLMSVQLKAAVQAVSKLPTKEQLKLQKVTETAIAELDNLFNALAIADLEVVNLIKEAKFLESEYAYSFDATTGKKVFPKSSEFNAWYSSTLKVGRTALTEFKRYEKMYGIDKVVNLSTVSKAQKDFGMSHSVGSSQKIGMNIVGMRA